MLARSGLAALSDLDSDEWREVYETLAGEQEAVLRKEGEFRSADYRWPRDALRNWSRSWEYPYVYSCLRRWRASWSGTSQPLVLDVGSGVTFFPFAVAKLGVTVRCLDVDPVCERDLSRAAGVVDCGPGSVSAALSRPHELPCADQGADAVYCISVLEHEEEFERLIEEMARVLRPGGILLLTLDLDVRQEGWALDVPACKRLRKALAEDFESLYPEQSVHPVDVLLSNRAPHGFEKLGAASGMWYFAKQLVKPLFGRPRRRWPPFHLAVLALALRSRA